MKDPLVSEVTDWFEFSLLKAVGVRDPVFLFLLIWLGVLLDVKVTDFDWLRFFWLRPELEADLVIVVEENETVVIGILVLSWPNTLSDWVTIVSTKLEVVNLLELAAFSFGVLLPLLFFSSVTPLSSTLGLIFLFLIEALDLKFEFLRLALFADDLTIVSDSFSGDESDDPLSAGIGLYGGIVLTFPPFF